MPKFGAPHCLGRESIPRSAATCLTAKPVGQTQTSDRRRTSTSSPYAPRWTRRQPIAAQQHEISPRASIPSCLASVAARATLASETTRSLALHPAGAASQSPRIHNGRPEGLNSPHPTSRRREAPQIPRRLSAREKFADPQMSLRRRSYGPAEGAVQDGDSSV
jgi:hypothetical protein